MSGNDPVLAELRVIFDENLASGLVVAVPLVCEDEPAFQLHATFTVPSCETLHFRLVGPDKVENIPQVLRPVQPRTGLVELGFVLLEGEHLWVRLYRLEANRVAARPERGDVVHDQAQVRVAGDSDFRVMPPELTVAPHSVRPGDRSSGCFLDGLRCVNELLTVNNSRAHYRTASLEKDLC